MKRIIFLLCLVFIVSPVSANPLDDLWSFITGSNNTEPLEAINATGNITSSFTGDAITATYTGEIVSGTTLELFCQDNTARYMSVWGGSITKESTSWSFALKDIKRENTDGCYFAVVDSTAEMMR